MIIVNVSVQLEECELSSAKIRGVSDLAKEATRNSRGDYTISSSQIGHTSLALAASLAAGAPMLILEVRSWGPKSAAGLDEGGERDCCEFEYWDTELASEGA